MAARSYSSAERNSLRAGRAVVAIGYLLLVLSVAPLLYQLAFGESQNDWLKQCTVFQVILATFGGMLGLGIAFIGTAIVHKARHGKWPIWY